MCLDATGLAMCDRAYLGVAVETAWRAFDRAADLRSRVTPAVPILFFGDLPAYRSSRLRVLTVGRFVYCPPRSARKCSSVVSVHQCEMSSRYSVSSRSVFCTATSPSSSLILTL